MLIELRIKNFAIIDALELEFDPGLVILTGETGAGKSIIMGALDMLLGLRVDMSTLRKGSEFASVEAVFKIPPHLREPIIRLLEEEDILEGDEYLTLTRELRKDKRNTARVNGHRTNVAVLVQLLKCHLVVQPASLRVPSARHDYAQPLGPAPRRFGQPRTDVHDFVLGGWGGHGETLCCGA